MTSGKIITTEDGETALFKYSCKYNDGVGCSKLHRHCERCGWNPAVAKARLEKFCHKHGIAVPLPQRTEEE